MTLLDGKRIASEIRRELRDRVLQMRKKPELAVVLAASMLAFASKNFRKQIDFYSNAAHGQKPPATEPAVATENAE